MILMKRLFEKLNPEKDAMMQWHMQAVNTTTNIKVKMYFTIPALSSMNVVIWKCQVDEYANGIYDMILGRYLLTELVLNLKLTENFIKADD